ncbi:hypothetical protein AGMMS50218_16950 [Actinomycetota bacterium]|nr:hypothetical protein AGMMS50218_16950 [Actinomycetota bacterium]
MHRRTDEPATGLLSETLETAADLSRGGVGVRDAGDPSKLVLAGLKQVGDSRDDGTSLARPGSGKDDHIVWPGRGLALLIGEHRELLC